MAYFGKQGRNALLFYHVTIVGKGHEKLKFRPRLLGAFYTQQGVLEETACSFRTTAFVICKNDRLVIRIFLVLEKRVLDT